MRFYRRYGVILLTVLLAAGACCAQAGSRPGSKRSDEERTVAALLADNGRAPIPGFLETLVARLGDGAAVGVIQYLGERKTSVSDDAISRDEVERSLAIVRMAFAAPNVIQLDENRVPKATLILLRYLNVVSDGSVRDDVASTSRFVEELKFRQLKQSEAAK
jgi:hypothetical protein